MSNVWGRKIKLSIFGESHGDAIGVIIDGLPPGMSIDWDNVERQMKRRAPGNSPLSTPRRESDNVEIISGYFNERTTGTPLCAMIRNENTISRDYKPNILRPGHADLSAHFKYKGFADYRGGGHFSGRLTAPLVFAGALARQILNEKGIKIGARILQIHSVKDEPMEIENIISVSEKSFPVYSDEKGQKMQEIILEAKAENDSLGGIIECAAFGLSGGLGDPFFESMESVISSMMFSIPAVKGISFGDGFGLASMKGSEANDQMFAESSEIKFKSNHNGGITGGITNGNPLVFQVAIKPTPTIFKEQTTVDIDKMETVSVNLKGRHDPCIVPRAVCVIEAGLAIALLDTNLL